MNTRKIWRHPVRTTLVLASLSVIAGGAMAADPAAGTSTSPTKEAREKMAVLHEQMAACLRSDKAISECHQQMRKGCQESLGDQGCPMMGMGKRSHKMRPGGTPR